MHVNEEKHKDKNIHVPQIHYYGRNGMGRGGGNSAVKRAVAFKAECQGKKC